MFERRIPVKVSVCTVAKATNACSFFHYKTLHCWWSVRSVANGSISSISISLPLFIFKSAYMMAVDPSLFFADRNKRHLSEGNIPENSDWYFSSCQLPCSIKVGIQLTVNWQQVDNTEIFCRKLSPANTVA